MNIDLLKQPFDPSRISWRVGSTSGDKTKGLALAYIDARDVMERLDDVCGVGGWQCQYTHADKIVICSLGIKIDGEWVWKSNGAGETDVEGEKGAASDAFKRAAVLWGVGRYLYDVKSPWVALEPMGKSYKIKDTEHKKLEAILPKPTIVAVNSPQKANDDTIKRTEEWYGKALKEVSGLMDTAAVEAWEASHSKHLEKLKSIRPDLYGDIIDALAIARGE